METASTAKTTTRIAKTIVFTRSSTEERINHRRHHHHEYVVLYWSLGCRQSSRRLSNQTWKVQPNSYITTSVTISLTFHQRNINYKSIQQTATQSIHRTKVYYSTPGKVQIGRQHSEDSTMEVPIVSCKKNTS